MGKVSCLSAPCKGTLVFKIYAWNAHPGARDKTALVARLVRVENDCFFRSTHRSRARMLSRWPRRWFDSTPGPLCMVLEEDDRLCVAVVTDLFDLDVDDLDGHLAAVQVICL